MAQVSPLGYTAPSSDVRAPQATEHERQRPLWLVALLTFLWSYWYFGLWFAWSWEEMKRELEDDSMHPWWHTASLVVPILGFFQIFAHGERLNWMLTVQDLRPRVHSGVLVIGFIVATVLKT